MKELTENTSIKLSVVKAWQVAVAIVVVTGGVASVFYVRDNERQLREQEFRHQLLDQMKGYVTYMAFNEWIDALERKNPSLVLPRIRQAAVEEPIKKSFQAAQRGNSFYAQ